MRNMDGDKEEERLHSIPHRPRRSSETGDLAIGSRRAGDALRDQVIDRLKDAHAQGALEAEVMEARVTRALTTYIKSDLQRLVSDLPATYKVTATGLYHPKAGRCGVPKCRECGPVTQPPRPLQDRASNAQWVLFGALFASAAWSVTQARPDDTYTTFGMIVLLVSLIGSFLNMLILAKREAAKRSNGR